LIFWSLVTLGTALAQNYWQLVACRALEGFGEAFYFPASMSLISDYHGPVTRSRAMSIHQSSVYAGTILGGSAAGWCADAFGWRSGFYLFGSLGVALGIVLLFLLKEPQRGEAESNSTARAPNLTRSQPGIAGIDSVVRIPMALALMAVFVGANFVASIFLTLMPSFMNDKFHMSLTMAGLNSTVWLQIASVLGVICGGILADRLARRHPRGRMMIQAGGLLLGVPFIFFTGWTFSVPALVLALVGFGFFKGLYDANIWASLYDVVPVKTRATTVGLTNAIGWFGGGFAPVAIAMASAHFGMSACISATSLIYLVFGLVLMVAIRKSS
jgi:MFS family permease